MKVLLDSCVSGQAAQIVRQAGHDVEWAGDWPKDPGDEEILRRAAAESRVLATIDKDFGELVIVQGMVHLGLIRWGSAPASRGRRSSDCLQLMKLNLWPGRF